MPELTVAFDEWYCRSLPFLDPAKTRDDYLAAFLSEWRKVRVPTGEGALAAAGEKVRKLAPDELPIIPKKPDACETWRRLAALHRELSIANGGKTHFLSYRDAGEVIGVTHQQAHDITGALYVLEVIDIVNNGEAKPHGGKAAEFRYLL
jgi:hypothetical protein